VGLQVEGAADVLEAMEPDDAADLLSELPPERQEELLEKMDQDEAEDLRRLLTYEDDTAGGLTTTEPVIMGPEASIAEALALVRREELATALATTVFVCRPPLETPTGRYLGMVHIQRLLREPPHAPIGGLGILGDQRVHMAGETHGLPAEFVRCPAPGPRSSPDRQGGVRARRRAR